MIYTLLGIAVGLSFTLAYVFVVKFKAVILSKQERKEKGLLVINGKKLF